MNRYQPAVVIDNGSGMIKAGLAGTREPQFVYPNILGRTKGHSTSVDCGELGLCVGEKAHDRRSFLSISYPVDRGLISSWGDMEIMWKHIYDHNLNLKASDGPVLVTEPALNPMTDRQHISEVFFENLGVPAFYISVQAVLALFAAGFTTGLVLNSGAGITQCVPIFEGYCLPHGVKQLNVAGFDLTTYLMMLLKDDGVALLRTGDRKIVAEIKENACYVAMDYEEEMAKEPSLEKTYTLPDGKTFKLHEPVFRCPEALFSPWLVNVDEPGIDKMCFSSIMKCDTDLRNSFFSNIILSGGSTSFPGLDKRLIKDVAKLAPANTPVQVTSPRSGKYQCGWEGLFLHPCLPSKTCGSRLQNLKKLGPI